jgi:hypothetical protein
MADGLGWVGFKNFGLGWVGFSKSDPRPTLKQIYEGTLTDSASDEADR